MAELLDRLIRDHGHLWRLLDLLDELLDRFHEGGELDYELMHEMLEYIESYTDQVHHPSEENIFERLRAHAGGPYPVLDQLTDQHLELSRITKRFCQSLEAIVHEAVVRRDVLELQGRELSRAMREHLDLEERAAFPLAREGLSKSDWDALLPAAANDEDPLFGATGQRRFHALVRHLTDGSRK